MSAFEARVNIGSLGVRPIQDPNNPTAPAVQAELSLGIVSLIPAGDGQLMPIPFGMIHAGLDKRTIENLITELQKISTEMAEPSKIVTASDLSGVDQMAKVADDLRG